MGEREWTFIFRKLFRVSSGMTDTELAEKAIAGNDDAHLSLMFTYRDAFYRGCLKLSIDTGVA